MICLAVKIKRERNYPELKYCSEVYIRVRSEDAKKQRRIFDTLRIFSSNVLPLAKLASLSGNARLNIGTDAARIKQ